LLVPKVAEAQPCSQQPSPNNDRTARAYERQQYRNECIELQLSPARMSEDGHSYDLQKYVVSA
jgi:hypothetical protein